MVTESQESVLSPANDVIDLCWIFYNKPRIVATFFFQQTIAFELYHFL